MNAEDSADELEAGSPILPSSTKEAWYELAPNPRPFWLRVVVIFSLWFALESALRAARVHLLRTQSVGRLRLVSGGLYFERGFARRAAAPSRATREAFSANSILKVEWYPHGYHHPITLGLIALTLGTMVGSVLFMESLKARSGFPAALLGLSFVLFGLGFDFLWERGGFSRRAPSRLTIFLRAGQSFTLFGLPEAEAERILAFVVGPPSLLESAEVPLA